MRFISLSDYLGWKCHNLIIALFLILAWIVLSGVFMLKKVYLRKKCSLILVLVFLAFCSCSEPMSTTAKGTLAGVATGAGVGLIAGSQTGSAGAGAAIGAGVGAIGGAIVGASLEAQEEESKTLDEQHYNNKIEIERQQRETEDMRRQQRYDDLYRQY